MVVAVALAVMATGLALYVAALSRRFALAPGFADQRWFSRAAAAVACFSAMNLPIAAGSAPQVVVGAARLQLAFGALFGACWIRYTAAALGRPGRFDRALVAAAVGLAAAAVVPGLVLREGYVVRAYAPLGIVYHDPITTPLGDAYLGVLLLLLVAPAARSAAAWRRGVPHAGLHLLAVALLFAMTGVDVLTTTGVVSLPYLLDLAFVGPVCVVGYALTARFAADARALDDLRGRLESLVEVRTAELARAQDALHRAEKLASLGQFAAGVAHEVNNPNAVVASNLAYLEGELRRGAVPEDALECVRDAQAAAQRIARIVRQLLDSGRVAAVRPQAVLVPLAAAAREALRIAQARCPAHVALVSLVAPDLHVLGDEGPLVQVLVNLVVNGAQAVPEGRAGRVEIAAARDGGRVRLTVVDDGAGMAPDVLQRAFEPFYSTKPFGAGTGLGLAVSRGLVGSLGGDLALDSAPGRGTVATITLRAADGSAAARADAA